MIDCKDCLHDGVCVMQEECENIEEQLEEFGCDDYKARADWVEQKHGRWKRRGRNLGECSECGEVVAARHRYCPNCGAKMDVEGYDGKDSV